MKIIKIAVLFFIALMFSLSAKADESVLTFQIDKSAKKIRVYHALDKRFIQEFDASAFAFTLYYRPPGTDETVENLEFFPKIFVFSHEKQAALTSQYDQTPIKLNKSFFFDIKTGHVLKEINERIIALLPGEKGFLSWNGKEIRRYNTIDAGGQAIVSLVHYNPIRIAVSPDTHFMAVEMCSCGGPVCESNFCWVKLFDLLKNTEVKEFEEEANRGSRIVGEFDESGRYYYARNKEVLIGGKPFDEHKKFDLEKLVWESGNF